MLAGVLAFLCLSATVTTIESSCEPLLVEERTWQASALNLPERGYSMTLRNTTSGGSHAVSHPMMSVGQITGLHILGDWLVGIGVLGTTSDFIIAAKLENPQETHFYRAFRPAVSKAGKRVAYERYYPRFAQSEEISPALEVISFQESAEPHTVFPVHKGPERDKRDRVHQPVSPIAWSPDGQRLAFVDKYAKPYDWKEYQQYWVLITFTHEEEPQADVRPLPLPTYIRPDFSPEKVALVLLELRWLDTDTLCGQIAGGDAFWKSLYPKISPAGEYVGVCEELP